MNDIKITKTLILFVVASSAFVAYNNWRQNIDTPDKGERQVIKNTATEKTAAANGTAVSDENTWDENTGYKYIYTAGIPVVYN